MTSTSASMDQLLCGKKESTENTAAIEPLALRTDSRGKAVLPTLAISDFGIADVQDMVFGDRSFATVRGTPEFMAPEVFERDTSDARVDLYAAGVTFWYLLCGGAPMVPSSCPDAASPLAETTEQSAPRIAKEAFWAMAPHVPTELIDIAAALMHPNPAERPRTAALVFDTLLRWFERNAAEHRCELGQLPTPRYDPYLSASTFCGRAQELLTAGNFLRQNLRPAPQPHSGEPRELAPSVLRIFGEAGIGKSRFTSQLRRQAARSYRVLSFLTDREMGTYKQLLAFNQELESFYHQKRLRVDCRQPQLEALRQPASGCYVPDIEFDADPRFSILRDERAAANDPRGVSEARERYRLERFSALLRLYSYERPLCLVIEDAQWLDRPSLRLLGTAMRYLAASKADGHAPQVAFVYNHRPREDGDRLEELLDEIDSVGRIEGPAVEIALLPFNAQSAAALVESMLGLEPASREAFCFVAALKSRIGALRPISVEQSLWSLFTEGSLIVRDESGRWSGSWNLDPELLARASVALSVRDAIGNRAARFDSQTLRVLSVAAAVGKLFDLELVARAARLAASDVLTAVEYAGSAGFLCEMTTAGQDYLADRALPAVTYGFSHDRYREAILRSLLDDVLVTLHSDIAAAIKARWGENESTFERLAEHCFEARDFASARRYAESAADLAFRSGDNEQAAKSYRIAVASLERGAAQAPLAVPLELRERLATSLESIGRFVEASLELQAMLETEGLADSDRTSVNRRLAESYHRQQDYRNAVAPLLAFLSSQGVHVPPAGLFGLVAQLPGFLLMFAGPLFPVLINKKEAEDADAQAQIQQSLYTLIECGAFVDPQLSIRAVWTLSWLLMREGRHPFSGPLFQLLGYMTASQGLFGLSRRYAALGRAFDEERSERPLRRSVAAKKTIATADRARANTAALGQFLLLGRKLYAGEIGPEAEAELSQIIARGLKTAEESSDLQRQWTIRSTFGVFGYCSGRISMFRHLYGSVLQLAKKHALRRLDSMYGPAYETNLHFLSGRYPQAIESSLMYGQAASEAGSAADRYSSEYMFQLAVSLAAAPPPESTISRAIETLRILLEQKFSMAFTMPISGILISLVLVCHRLGRPISPELESLLRRAGPQCQRERQQRPFYLAALATAAHLKGHFERSLELFSEASEKASAGGWRGIHLLTILRVAQLVFRDDPRPRNYYREWERRLAESLTNQPPVTEQQLLAGALPPPPPSCRPEDLAYELHFARTRTARVETSH